MEVIKMYQNKIFIMILFVLSISVIPSLAAEKQLTIITEEWPPFNYTENGEVTGFSTEIVQHIMKELNVNYTIKIFPTARIMDILKEGPNIIFFTMLRIPERETLFKWIGPLGEDAIYFFKKKGNTLTIKTLEDAKKVKSISCRHIGLVYTILVNAGFTNLDVTPNSSGIYMKVLLDRCDLGIGETTLGVKYWLKQQNISTDALEQTPVKVVESQFYIACSKDIPDNEIALWQKALDKMKSSGEYKRLYQKYYR
jgi:polar amino acid transport system substrate-binding protein